MMERTFQIEWDDVNGPLWITRDTLDTLLDYVNAKREGRTRIMDVTEQVLNKDIQIAALETENERIMRCYESVSGKPVCGEGAVIRVECKQMEALRHQLAAQAEWRERAVEFAECLASPVAWPLHVGSSGVLRLKAAAFLARYKKEGE
jgi:hypothetical protein